LIANIDDAEGEEETNHEEKLEQDPGK